MKRAEKVRADFQGDSGKKPHQSGRSALTYCTNHHLSLRLNVFRDYYAHRSGMRPTGSHFNVCRKSRVTIKAKGAGFVAESRSVTGVKCGDFTGELLRGDVFVLAVERRQG